MQPIVMQTWRCHCGKVVSATQSGMPVSNYYSNEHKEVYCGPECGLSAYQQRKLLNNTGANK